MTEEVDRHRHRAHVAAARGRPAHRGGVFTALVNFIHAAHAADMAARQAEQHGYKQRAQRAQKHVTKTAATPPSSFFASSPSSSSSITAAVAAAAPQPKWRHAPLLNQDTHLNPHHVLGLAVDDTTAHSWSLSSLLSDYAHPASLPPVSETNYPETSLKREDGKDHARGSKGHYFSWWHTLGDRIILSAYYSWKAIVWDRLPHSARILGNAAFLLLTPALGIAGFMVVHTIGLSTFLLDHVVVMTLQGWEHLALWIWFMQWMIANIRGKTLLSKCVREARQLIIQEWSSVVREELEVHSALWRGVHEQQSRQQARQSHDPSPVSCPRTIQAGVSAWSITRGLVELFCIQDATWSIQREGLAPLMGREMRREDDGPSTMDDRVRGEENERKDKKMFVPFVRDSLQEKEDDLSNDSLEANLAEETFTDEEENDDGDGVLDDDMDMVVTGQDEDIMQVTRTPRLGPNNLGEKRASAPSRFSETDPASPSLSDDRRAGSRASPDRRIWAAPSHVHTLARTLRWAASLAISAYGMHAAPAVPTSSSAMSSMSPGAADTVSLPPPFTPSGLQLRRQAFAHLTRLSTEAVLHADIQTLDDGTSYSPTFYVVKDVSRQVIVVAIRGTQSFRDIMVDLEMHVSEVHLAFSRAAKDSTPKERTFICHSGILRAAQELANPESKLMCILRAELETEASYDLVLTGHSLGGAIASTLALLLADYVLSPPPPHAENAHELRESGVAPSTLFSTTSPSSSATSSASSSTEAAAEQTHPEAVSEERTGKESPKQQRQHQQPRTDTSAGGTWRTSPGSGLPAGRRIRAISFAPPATMSPALAALAAQGSPPLVLAATLGADIIPRCGHGQARELRRVLGALARMRSPPWWWSGAAMPMPSVGQGHQQQQQSQQQQQKQEQEQPPAALLKRPKCSRTPIVRTWIRRSWILYRLRRSRQPETRAQLQACVDGIERALWEVRCAIEADLDASARVREEGLSLDNWSPGSPWPPETILLRRRNRAVPIQQQIADRLARPTERKAGAGVPLLIPPGWNVWMGHGVQVQAQARDRDGASASAQAQTQTQAQTKRAPGRDPSGGAKGSACIRAGLELYHVQSPISFFALPWLHVQLLGAHFPSAYESALMGDLRL